MSKWRHREIQEPAKATELSRGWGPSVFSRELVAQAGRRGEGQAGQRRVRGCCLKALIRQLLGSSHCSAFPRSLWKGQGAGASKELRATEILSPWRQGRAFLLQREAGCAHQIETYPVQSLILSAPWGVSCCCPHFTDDNTEALRSDLPSATRQTQGRDRIRNQGL